MHSLVVSTYLVGQGLRSMYSKREKEWEEDLEIEI
jgi:hypothetical protein